MPPLNLQLQNALHECPYDGDLLFLPDDKLGELMKAELVQNYLLNSTNEKLRENYLQITDYVCGRPGRSNARGLSRRIFAILLIIEEPSLILDILHEGIDDNDLPLLSVNQEHQLCLLARKVGDTSVTIKAFDQWGYTKRFAFYSNQWRVQLPVFLKGTQSLKSHPVHRLNSKVIFPWTEYEKIYDGNSEVIRVKIHYAHRRFDAEEDRSFALKSLKPLRVQNSDNEFRLEVKALLKVKRRRHLEVNLLTTFEHQQRYHLLFRWADGGNLDDFWRKHPSPVVNYKWICWLAEQCYGLAYGLDGIHNTKMTAEEVEAIQPSPTSPTFAHAFTDTVSRSSTEEDDGKDFGRHGDIKPQNVLWFKQDKNAYNLGVLKLSDFGLTTFHRALTTKVSPVNVRVTPTYSAPERETHEKLSRPFDIWSLGCIFLEFVTWILLGINGLDKFNEERSAERGYRDEKFSLDNFYMLVKEDGRTRAEVKLSVRKVSIPDILGERGLRPKSQWIDDLKKKRECSPFLSEFLDYIRASMLLVDRSERDDSGIVSEQLKKMFSRCKQERSYALYSGAEELVEDNTATRSSLANQSKESLNIYSDAVIAATTSPTTSFENASLADDDRSTNKVKRKRTVGSSQHNTQGEAKRARQETVYTHRQL